MLLKSLQAVAILILSISIAYADNWPQWRGPSLNGVSSEKNLPVSWTTEENVHWKRPIITPPLASALVRRLWLVQDRISTLAGTSPLSKRIKEVMPWPASGGIV